MDKEIAMNWESLYPDGANGECPNCKHGISPTWDDGSWSIKTPYCPSCGQKLWNQEEADREKRDEEWDNNPDKFKMGNNWWWYNY